MNQINESIHDVCDKVDLNSKPKGRHIPVSKAINNWPNTKLPRKCTKVCNLTAPYVYWLRSYKWLCTAFSRHGEFQVEKCRELTKLIRIYEKWSEIKQSEENVEQISKDIVRTFPNNIFFQKNNCGYYSMFKVLSAYSNLNEYAKDNEEKFIKRMFNVEKGESPYQSTDSSTSQIVNDRKGYRDKRNWTLRSELIDSFWDFSFEDSTNYVQGMNFIVGILSYHLSPELAFSLFVKLMKDYDLENNYSPGLVGFKEKSDVLNWYITKHLSELSQFLVRTKLIKFYIGKP